MLYVHMVMTDQKRKEKKTKSGRMTKCLSNTQYPGVDNFVRVIDVPYVRRPHGVVGPRIRVRDLCSRRIRTRDFLHIPSGPFRTDAVELGDGVASRRGDVIADVFLVAVGTCEEYVFLLQVQGVEGLEEEEVWVDDGDKFFLDVVVLQPVLQPERLIVKGEVPNRKTNIQGNAHESCIRTCALLQGRTWA